MNWTIVATPLSAILLQSRSALFTFSLCAAVLFTIALVIAQVLSDRKIEGYLAVKEQEKLDGGMQLAFFS